MLKRIVTGIILLALVVYVIFFLPTKAFAIASAIVFLYGAWEWANLTKITSAWGKLFYLLFILMTFVVAGLLRYHLAIGLAILWWLFVAKTLFDFNHGPKTFKHTFFASKWTGALVFAPCWLGLNLLRVHGGINWVLAGLIVVWAADTIAYFVGKLFGKHPLASRISPKKTIEGVVGALIFSIFLGMIESHYLPIAGIQIPIFIALCFLTTIASIVGDLYESFLKRVADVKDSGQLLPGHGGLLDRIDGMLAAIPFFTLGVILFRMI